MIGSTKSMALICKRISLLNYKIATTNQLLQFNGQVYEQIDGVAMGSPRGTLMANVFICHLEETLTRDDLMLYLYKRYVDDTLARMPSAAAAVVLLITL